MVGRLCRSLLVVWSLVLIPALGAAHADDLEKELRRDLQENHAVIQQAKAKVATGDVRAESALLKRVAEKVRASHLLVSERLNQRKNDAIALGPKFSERQSQVSEAYTKALEEYLALVDGLPQDAAFSAATLDALDTLIDKLAPPRKRPLLGSLPYRRLAYPAREPATEPLVVPAYMGGSSVVTAADTAASAEAPVSKEIAELAQSLQWNPVLIYEWVKNNVETDWYWGAMKGAEETLRQRSGNDSDQAALLVSLLRASKFPARFVKGTIEFFPGLDQAKELTGIDDPLKIAAFLQRAGVPFKPVIAGGGIANFRVEHIWVECEVPYSNYRGAVIDDFGKTWLALDTSIKTAGYTYSAPLDIPESVTAPAVNEYLQGVQEQTPLEFLKQKAQAHLDANQPGKGWQDLLATRSLKHDPLKILPSSLQFKQIAITGEYQELPADLRHQVKVTASANGSELFSLGLDTLKVSNKRVVLSYEPETLEDQQIIDTYGGLDTTPPYLVRLRPVLKLDGERLAVAVDGLPMGGEFTVTTELITPNGAEVVSSTQIAGNLVVIAVVGQKAHGVSPIAPSDDAEGILFKEALGYIERWNSAEDELAAFFKVAVARPIPTVVTVGGVVDVTYLLGTPHGFKWQGVFIDAGLRAVEVTTRNGAPWHEKEFMRLSALQGSVLEERIFADDLKVESVSTAKVLQLAAQQGTALISLDKTNVDALLPTLPLDEAVKTDIANAVNQNLTVRVPPAEISYRDWTGIGYVKENTQTGESGWMLSGQLAGGMTAWRADLWPDAFAAILQNAYSEPPVYDPASATFITKITATELQQGTAGKALPQPLQVKVTDRKRKPVEGAEVTFTVKAGGGSFPGGATTITAITDSRGIASAPMTLGAHTADNPTSFWAPGDSHTQQVGENVIDATLASGVGLQAPFTLYGFPGKPVVMKSTYTDQKWYTVLSLADFVAVVLEDEYGNPVSNIPIQYTVADPVNNPDVPPCPSRPVSTQKTYLLGTGLACLNNSPVWGECGDPSTQTLTVSTGSRGAPVQVIMGGMANAIYKITATCADSGNPGVCTDPNTGKPFQLSLNRYTGEKISCGGSDSKVQLILTRAIVTDEAGRSIDAGKAGGTVPLRAKLYFVREDNGVFSIDTMPGGGGSVTFDGLPGTRVPDAADSLGMYQVDYPLQPGLNKVVIKGTGTTTAGSTPVTQTGLDEARLYGVTIKTQDIPPLRIGSSGELKDDVTISYSIDPVAYQASTAYVVLYRGNDPVAFIPSETTGGGSATLAKGFKFDMKEPYFVEVVLNLGSVVEMKSGRIPINLIGGQFEIGRRHLLAKFDDNVPAGSEWSQVDDYRTFNFILSSPSKVMAVLLDGEMKQKAVLVPQTQLAAGSNKFVLDYETLKQAGLSATYSPAFHVQVLYTPADGNPPYYRLYPGRMKERTIGRMLGQVMVHDVLIQDGSLNLSRQDFAFSGRGPQISFGRNYSNQDAAVGPLPLGEGWRHSLDLKLNPVSAQENGTGPVPDWVKKVKGTFFTEDHQSSQAWTTIQINEGIFKKYGTTWYAERGRHGTLEEAEGGFVFTAKDGTRYAYDYPVNDPTPVRAITDRNGNVTRFTYDAAGQLSRVTDAVQRSCNFTYVALPGLYTDDNSRLAAVYCSGDVNLNFSYNAKGYLQSVQRGTRVESYEYAAESAATGASYNLVKTTDSNNHSHSYGYYGLNEIDSNLANFVGFFKSQDVVKTVTYPDFKFAEFAYDVQTGNKRTVTDLRKFKTLYTLNFFGNPLQVDEPLGKTTRMTWSIDEGKNDNVMTSKTDAKGYPTLYEYDARGNIAKETDPYQNSVVTTWNQKYSLPELRIDRNNVTQSWVYDDRGNLRIETDGDGKKTSYQYYSTGEPSEKTEPRGNKTLYTYDQWGNQASVTGAEGSVTRNEYDIRGRRTASVDPRGGKTSYSYDALDYPATVTYPARSSYPLPSGSSYVKTTVYDAEGNLRRETDRLGLTLDYNYTVRDQVESVTRSTGGQKSFSYDENGNLLTETDWKGVPTTHTYDALNRRVTTANRLSHPTGMEYDLNGNLAAKTDAENRVTIYVYDKLNRLTSTIQPELPGQEPGTLVNTYYNEANPKTNLKSESDAEGHVTSYEYNGRYLRSKRIDAEAGEHLWNYDDNGNLESETDEEGRVTSFGYDKQNRRNKMIQPGQITTAYAYDPADNRTHVTDPRGNVTETRYDEWNRSWQVIDPDGYITTNELDGEGNQVRSVDGNGGVRSWVRDKRGLVRSATDAESNTTNFEYDLNGNKTGSTDPHGTITTIAYDAEDRQTTTIEALGQPEERTTGVLLYDRVGNPLQVRDGNGNVTVTSYNALNLADLVTDPRGFATETTYYRTGKVKTVKNRRGYVTSYEYDQLNRLVNVTDPLQQTLVTTYDKVGNVRTVTDKRSIVSETIYNGLNLPIEKRRGNVRLVTNEYDGAGNLTAVIDARDIRTDYSYSKRNLLDTTTFVDGSTRKRSYDGVGNLRTETDEEGKVTTYTYDKENRQTSVELADEKTDKIYDEIGNLKIVIKPESNSRSMEYDRLKRLASVTEGSLVTRYEYDKNGNVLNLYDPKGNRVEYTWDELNRKTSHIQYKAAGNLTTTFHYDEEGNLNSQTDPKRQTFGYVYDPLNRRTDESYPAETTPFMTLVAVKTQYDGNNNETDIAETKKDSQGGTVTDQTTNGYDDFDRLKSSSQRGVTVLYDYDANGNRTSVGTGSGNTTYTYDKRNRVESATVGSEATSLEYYPDGKKKLVKYPNGAGISYVYSPSNRVESVTNTAGGATISSYAYTYDRNGNRRTQVEVQNGSTTNTSYSYDTLDRMESFTVTGLNGSTATEYTFDGYNRATEKVTAPDGSVATKNYSYDETNWLTSVEDGARTVSYSYDANGNTVRKSDSADAGNDTVFDYDSANRLVRSMRGLTLLGLYDYDADGMRIRHRNSDRGDVDYFYDGKSVIEERTAAGSLLAHYNYADKLMSLATGSDTQYYHFDALGSTVNLTDAAGTAKVSYFLNPWGMILNQIGESTNRHIFTGKEEDPNTKLVYFGQRYYDADTGRFITEDSYLGKTDTPPSLHRYLYAYSNPTVYIDLEGNATVQQLMGADEQSVVNSLAKDQSFSNQAKQYTKLAAYSLWNGLTGGFLGRQDKRQEKLDRGEISKTDFQKGTAIDATVSIGTQVVAGGVLGKAASGGRLVKTMATGAAVSSGSSVVEQTAQVVTYQATDGRLGQEKIDAGQVLQSTASGAAVAAGFYGTGKVAQQVKASIAAGKAGGQAALTGENVPVNGNLVASNTTNLPAIIPEARNAPIQYTGEGDIFVRFSAYPNDFRITPTGGLSPGTYATTFEDSTNISSGFDATKRYALPGNQPAQYPMEIRPPAGTPIQRGRVAPARGVEGGVRTGGGEEVIFPSGVPDDSVTALPPLPRR